MQGSMIHPLLMRMECFQRLVASFITDNYIYSYVQYITLVFNTHVSKSIVFLEAQYKRTGDTIYCLCREREEISLKLATPVVTMMLVTVI